MYQSPYIANKAGEREVEGTPNIIQFDENLIKERRKWRINQKIYHDMGNPSYRDNQPVYMNQKNTDSLFAIYLCQIIPKNQWKLKYLNIPTYPKTPRMSFAK